MGIFDRFRRVRSTSANDPDSVGKLHITEIEGEHSLAFYCGELPVDEEIALAGHEPNGYFWEGVVEFGAPELAAEIELDSEGSMFSAWGPPDVLARLAEFLAPLVADGDAVTRLIERADSEGFEFDD